MISILKRNSCGKVSLLQLHNDNFLQQCLKYIVVLAATSKGTQFLFFSPCKLHVNAEICWVEMVLQMSTM